MQKSKLLIYILLVILAGAAVVLLAISLKGVAGDIKGLLDKSEQITGDSTAAETQQASPVVTEPNTPVNMIFGNAVMTGKLMTDTEGNTFYQLYDTNEYYQVFTGRVFAQEHNDAIYVGVRYMLPVYNEAYPYVDIYAPDLELDGLQNIYRVSLDGNNWTLLGHYYLSNGVYRIPAVSSLECIYLSPFVLTDEESTQASALEDHSSLFTKDLNIWISNCPDFVGSR